ncbi:MAG: wax ester/triacylglycerol synthase domain-containing protein [Acidimicrobiales bacterium]
MRQLNAQSVAAWSGDGPRTPAHVTTVGVYDGSEAAVSFETFVNAFERRLQVLKSFRERVVRVPLGLDDPFWTEDGRFDLDLHVRHVGLPRPGGWHELRETAASIHAVPLDRERPLWEVYLVDGADDVPGVPMGSFAVVTKVHLAVHGRDDEPAHTLADVVHDDPPLGAARWQPEPHPPGWALIARAAVNVVRRPARRVLGAGGPHVPGVPKLPALSPEALWDAPVVVRSSPFNRRVSAHRSFDALVLRAGEIEGVLASVPGATVDDVVLAVVVGGLRAYLDTKGVTPPDPLVAMVPIPSPPAGASPTGDAPAATIAALHADGPDDRLRSTAASTRRAVQLAGLGAASPLPPPRGSSQLAAVGIPLKNPWPSSRQRKCNTALTHIDALPRGRHLAGAPVVRWFALGPLTDHVGLVHTVTGVDGSTAVSVTACRDLLPDPEVYVAQLRQAFDALVT